MAGCGRLAGRGFPRSTVACSTATASTTRGGRTAASRSWSRRTCAGSPPGRGRAAPPTVLLPARRLPVDLARRQTRGVAAVLLPFPRDAAPPWGGLKLIGQASAVAGRIAPARGG